MIFLLPTAILLIVGWLIKYKKVTWLISGYNTASKEEKEKYDIEKLCRYMGDYLFILAALFLMMSFLPMLYPEYEEMILWIMGGMIAVVAIGGIVFLSTGNRVKKQ